MVLALSVAGCVYRPTTRYYAVSPRPDFVEGHVSSRTFVVGPGHSPEDSAYDAVLCGSSVCIAGVRQMLEIGLRSSLGHVATEAAVGASRDYVAWFDVVRFDATGGGSHGRYGGWSETHLSLEWSFELAETTTGRTVVQLADTETMAVPRVDDAVEALAVMSRRAIRAITEALRHSPLTAG